MAGFEVVTQQEAAASRDVVFGVLTDVRRSREWTSVLKHVDGDLAVGARPRFQLDPPRGRGYAFRPTITVRDDPGVLEWVVRTGAPGVFDGRHRFELSDTEGGGTLVLNSEHFTGLLSPVLRRLVIDPDDVRHGFEVLNDDLRRRAKQLSDDDQRSRA